MTKLQRTFFYRAAKGLNREGAKVKMDLPPPVEKRLYIVSGKSS